jgi:iron complex outermembrane recepter protein
LTGYQQTQVPKWSMSFTADYDWALMGDWHAHVGGAWRRIGPLWTLLVESRSLGAGPTLELPAYSIVDLNTSLATGSMVLRVYARNLTDTRASRHGHLNIDPSGTMGYNEDFMVQPRTAGVGVDYSF